MKTLLIGFSLFNLSVFASSNSNAINSKSTFSKKNKEKIDLAVIQIGDQFQLPGTSLQIFNKKTQKKVYEVYLGDAEYEKGLRKKVVKKKMGPDTIVPIASASKWVSAYTILLMVEKGWMNLNDTTGKWLGWKDKRNYLNNITLSQALSFTSGLPGDLKHLKVKDCTINAKMKLNDCVQTMYKLFSSKKYKKYVKAPGSMFYYGNVHMHIAAAMALKAYKKKKGKNISWNDLFNELVKKPLKLSKEVFYYTNPRMPDGKTNPLIAGGLVMSINDYAKILGEMVKKVRTKKSPWNKFTTDHFQSNTKIVFSPSRTNGWDYHYSLGNWRECDKEPECKKELVNSSSGKFGFNPWFDRQGLYYGILGNTFRDEGAGVLSMEMGKIIRAALPKRKKQK